MNNPKGLEIGARHISVSTSGLVPRIYDLANEKNSMYSICITTCKQ